MLTNYGDVWISLQTRTDSAPKNTQARNLDLNNCGLLAKYGCIFRSKFYTESSLLTCAATSARPSSAFLPHPKLELCPNKECKRKMHFLSLWHILFGDVHACEPAKTQMCDMLCTLIPKLIGFKRLLL